MKKIIIIISVILGIIAIVFGAYFAWKKLKIISDQPAFYYWLTNSTTTADIFYINQVGQILKIKEDGDDEIISDRQIDNLQSVEANKDGGKIIVKHGSFE